MLFLCLFLQMPLNYNTNVDFADYLMQQHDYFRAISEYKRVLFFCQNDSIRYYCMTQIAKSYRKSRRFDSGVSYSNEVLNQEQLQANLRWQNSLNVGLAYLENNQPHLSLPFLQKTSELNPSLFVQLSVGLAHLRLRQWGKASERVRQAAFALKDTTVKAKISLMADSIDKFSLYPQKSPVAASLLSAILPGSGQAYSGHTYDAIQAFLYTFSIGFSSFALYKYEKKVKGRLQLTYIGFSITSLFYVGNIMGARRTAKYRNWRLESDFSKRIQEEVMQYEP